MLDFFEIIWGSILTMISSMVLGYFLGALGSFAGILIVTACVGYRVNIDMVNGAVHGSIVAVLGGALSFIIMLGMWGIGIGPGSTIMEFGVMGIVIGLLIDLIVGASGGSIGSVINK